MIFEEKTISSKIVYEGPIFRIRQHLVETVAENSLRDIIEHTGGGIMLAITDEGKIVMERQYRKSIETAPLELPAGKTDEGEDPFTTAVRELAEETGYTASSVKHLISFHPTFAYSTEYLHIYVCRGLIKGETHWDSTECLEIEEYTPDEALEMIKSGEITDAKTIIGLLYARFLGEI